MNKREIMEKIEIYGVKKCSKCGIDYPNMEDYYYVTKGTKDGFRNDCKRCHDTQKLRKIRDDLKEKSNVKVIIAKNKEIHELRRRLEIAEEKNLKLINTIELTDERNESLSDTAARFQEKYKYSRNGNCVLGVCLAMVTIGTGIIIFL